KKNDDEAAIADWSKYFEKARRGGVALLNRALLYVKKGENAKAIDDLDRAIHLRPTEEIVRMPGGNERLATLEDGVPSLGCFFAVRGLAYFNEGKLDKALNDLNHGIELGSPCVQARATRGSLLVRKGQFTEAIQDFDQVLWADPEDAGARSDRCF